MAYRGKSSSYEDDDIMPSFDNKKLHQWLIARQIDRTLRFLPDAFVKAFNPTQAKNNIMAMKIAMDALNFLIAPIGKKDYRDKVPSIQKKIQDDEARMVKGRMTRYHFYNDNLYPWLMEMSDQLEPAGLASPKLVYKRFPSPKEIDEMRKKKKVRIRADTDLDKGTPSFKKSLE